MSIWSPDLTRFQGPRYQALVDAIGEAVANGELKPGQRLPPRRDLAHSLGFSINTVSSAYIEAERRGLVFGEVGRGTFVRGAARTPGGESAFLIEGRPRDLIDLSICRPCRLEDYIRLLQETLAELAGDDDLNALMACRPVIGLGRHRSAASQWLAGLGVDAPAERIVLTNGCAHALLVALSALVQPGETVVTEELTDYGLISLASVLHFRLVGLATDSEGILPDAFEAACRRGDVKVLVATPTLTNPTCALMSADRRRRIAAIAGRHDVSIVEDDVFGPLVEDRPPPLSSFLPDNSYYVTSFTKSAVSGLRTGYLVPPAYDIQRMVARVRTTSWMATPLVAEIASRWIVDGTMSEAVARQRQEFAARQRLVEGALDGHAVRRHPTACNVWLPLPPPWRADNFVAQARIRGVALSPPEPYVVGRSAEPHAVRLSVGAAHSRGELAEALNAVRGLLAQQPEPAWLPI